MELPRLDENPLSKDRQARLVPRNIGSQRLGRPALFDDVDSVRRCSSEGRAEKKEQEQREPHEA